MSTVKALVYLRVRGPVDEWREFGTRIVGAQLVPSDDPTEARFRFDEREYRLTVEDGPPGADALIALGFETRTSADLDALVRRLDENSVPVSEDVDLARARNVQRLIAFADPDGNPIEVVFGHPHDHTPFVSPRGIDFVTGDLGLGHVFLFASDAQRSAEFYQSMLGFRPSDTIAFGPTNAVFLHCNPRHHTVALAALPGFEPGIGHVMLELSRLDSVGRALDLAMETPGQVVRALGEHTNDEMTSFYLATPSGFAIEYGWNGRLVDDDSWTVGHYRSASTWGHQVLADVPSAVAVGADDE
ncbi:VOC family protein [Rhodococcus sp. 2H158]